jgi:mannose-6-phosphate isomerase
LSESRELLIACPFFALERWMLGAAQPLATDPGTFEILTLIEGVGALQWSGGEISLQRGVSVVVPATLGSYTLQPDPQATAPPQLLRVYVPDLERDLLTPLRTRGVEAARIAQTIVQ